MNLPTEGPTDFIRPHLDALHRVREREPVHPDALTLRAERLLEETFGEVAEPVRTGYAQGHVGIVSEHTYYFEGFALLVAVPFGTAVAVRRARASHASCVVEHFTRTIPQTLAGESIRVSSRGADSEDARAELTARLLRRVAEEGDPFQVAVVSDVPSCCEDGYYASVVVAARHAMADGEFQAQTVRAWARDLGEVLARPCGVAPILGAAYCAAGSALLVDTGLVEHIAVQLPDVQRMVWAMVDTAMRPEGKPGIYKQRQEQTAEVVDHLKKIGLGGPDGIRDLEHRHLQLALKRIPRKLQPVLRYLVTENRRVQRLVAALRQGDPQLFGAFLQMSQAAIENDWKERNLALTRIQALAESVEGIEGVRRVGREFGSGVLLTGTPLAMMPFLDRLSSERFSERGPALRSYLI